jgi:uncharacterized protein DUF4239
MAQSVAGSIVIILICIASALAFLFLIHRLWIPSRRQLHNDAIGPNVSVIGTTYAVLIAFMLSGVWNEMQAASVNTEQEANSLVNIFRFAQQLPSDARAEIQKLARDYARVMIDEEWQDMTEEKSSPEGHAITHALWSAIANVQPHTATEQQFMDHSLNELTTMTEHRRIRLLQSRQRLPPLLWAVLIVGGIVTVGSTCLFGIEDFKLHIVQVFEISFLISLMLIAIAAIDRPFQGQVHVPSDAFRYALDTMDSRGWK